MVLQKKQHETHINALKFEYIPSSECEQFPDNI